MQSTVIGTDWSIGPEMEVNVGVNAGPATVGVSRKIEPLMQGQETDTKRLAQMEKFFTSEKGVMVKLEASCYYTKLLLDRFGQLFEKSI